MATTLICACSAMDCNGNAIRPSRTIIISKVKRVCWKRRLNRAEQTSSTSYNMLTVIRYRMYQKQRRERARQSDQTYYNRRTALDSTSFSKQYHIAHYSCLSFLAPQLLFSLVAYALTYRLLLSLIFTLPVSLNNFYIVLVCVFHFYFIIYLQFGKLLFKFIFHSSSFLSIYFIYVYTFFGKAKYFSRMGLYIELQFAESLCGNFNSCNTRVRDAIYFFLDGNPSLFCYCFK